MYTLTKSGVRVISMLVLGFLLGFSVTEDYRLSTLVDRHDIELDREQILVKYKLDSEMIVNLTRVIDNRSLIFEFTNTDLQNKELLSSMDRMFTAYVELLKMPKQYQEHKNSIEAADQMHLYIDNKYFSKNEHGFSMDNRKSAIAPKWLEFNSKAIELTSKVGISSERVYELFNSYADAYRLKTSLTVADRQDITKLLDGASEMRSLYAYMLNSSWFGYTD